MTTSLLTVQLYSELQPGASPSAADGNASQRGEVTTARNGLELQASLVRAESVQVKEAVHPSELL
jgi:hypothetical protein